MDSAHQQSKNNQAQGKKVGTQAIKMLTKRQGERVKKEEIRVRLMESDRNCVFGNNSSWGDVQFRNESVQLSWLIYTLISRLIMT